nr:YqcC family protein [Marinobacterium ramblicola]
MMEIEREMRALDLWSQTMPDAQSLMSQQPFCIDTLEFHKWIQWLLLPRLQHLVLAQLPLPESCAVAPMAEEVFKAMEENTEHLLELLVQLDQAVTDAT